MWWNCELLLLCKVSIVNIQIKFFLSCHSMRQCSNDIEALPRNRWGPGSIFARRIQHETVLKVTAGPGEPAWPAGMRTGGRKPDEALRISRKFRLGVCNTCRRIAYRRPGPYMVQIYFDSENGSLENIYMNLYCSIDSHSKIWKFWIQPAGKSPLEIWDNWNYLGMFAFLWPNISQ